MNRETKIKELGERELARQERKAQKIAAFTEIAEAIVTLLIKEANHDSGATTLAVARRADGTIAIYDPATTKTAYDFYIRELGKPSPLWDTGCFHFLIERGKSDDYYKSTGWPQGLRVWCVWTTAPRWQNAVITIAAQKLQADIPADIAMLFTYMDCNLRGPRLLGTKFNKRNT